MRPAAHPVVNMADGDQNGEFLYAPSGAAQVNKMIREHSELFSDSQCRVCSAVLISESQKLAHYQSKKHANKVRRYMSIRSDDELSAKRLKTSTDDTSHSNGEVDRYKACSVCNMTFKTRVVAESHYQGKVHAKNLKLKTCGFQNPALTLAKGQAKKKADGQATAPQGPAEGDPNRFCAICHASFNNPLMAKQHYAGKKHKKQLTKMKLMETYGPASVPASTVKGYPCTVCNIELNSVEQYQAHITGSKHRNHMRLKQESGPLASPAQLSEHCPPDQQVAPEDWRNCSAGLRETRE
ncbi:zinc finger protein 346 isoform X1 [Scleropages formosus]|uniref:Zinc finger protein 346 n=1 Tax=Scleropages formosus TaxID=113540 RepID=A0A8C9RLK6_SCLFO|nr:zinc finger protein 346 isoform X1 [Scleropages formosus]